MSYNFLTLTSALVSNCLNLEISLYFPFVQSYLKAPASFWICQLCFSVQNYLCKTPAEIY